MSAAVSHEPVPSPRAWLRLALFGSFVYLATQLMQFFPAAASRATGISATTLGTWSPLASGAGLVLFFWGVVAAFWRVNRVAGHTGAGVAGLVAGTVGVLLLATLELSAIASVLGVPSPLLTALGAAAPLVQVFGTFLAFAGLATLGVGLAHAVWLTQPVVAADHASEEPRDYGSSGYRSY